MNEGDWMSDTCKMSVEEKVLYLNGRMESAVSLTFQDLLKKKKEKKRRIPREVRSLYRRKTNLSKKIHRTKSRVKIVSQMDELERIELDIRNRKES